MKKMNNLKNNKIKYSLIISTYNDEKTISSQINSILNQTLLPSEIIILDALSCDNTTKIIKSFKNKRIKLIEMDIDIGTGRNVAISEAENDIIFVTDGGCILDKNWAYEISKLFKNKEINVVGGVFKPIYKNFFEKCQGVIVCKPIEKINPETFLPSSRSFAFRKEVWKEVGGYPKHEIGGEDTRFVLNILKKGYKIHINKRAIVYWKMRSPLKNFIKQFYLYARGEVRSGNLAFPQMKPVLIASIIFSIYLIILLFTLIFFRSIFLVLIIIPLIYFLYQGLKVAIRVKDIRGIYYGFILSFFKRFAYFSGIWAEILLVPTKDYRNENY